jgi:signal transduction histidine kinase
MGEKMATFSWPDQASSAGATATLEGGFSQRLRRSGLLLVCASLPLVTAIGALTHGRQQYVVAFVLLASGLYTTPALVITWLAIQRSPAGDRRHWQMWLVADLLVYITGLSMLGGVFFGWSFGDAGGPVIVLLIGVCLTLGLVRLVRSRSGRRALSVNLAESVMSTVMIVAPAILLWGEQIVRSDDAWFTIPAALSTVGMISGLYWTVLLYVRQGDERCVLETMGIALTLLGIVNGGLQVAQGVSGFTLPSAPLIAAHAACMSLLLLVPLNARHRPGRSRKELPLQSQVRGARLTGLLILTGLPVLLVVTLALQDERPWATGFSLGVVALLLVLAALRQLAAVQETRRLYAQVERAAADRHELLVRMMRRSDDDRHRVAAQLHEQAISAYATFVSFLQATQPRTGTPAGPGAGAGSGSPSSEASSLVREDLARQAESLRQLMLAIRPLEVDRRRSESLDAPIQAYLDSLYGDSVTPRLSVSVDPELVLDWITETLVFRIVQEALRNTWRHSEARRVSVEIGSAGPAVEVRISDDGVGFDPSAALFESGIAAMRSFAAVGDGSLEIESAPGQGTLVIARLGEPATHPATTPEPDPGAAAPAGPGSAARRHLHAVTT